MLLILNVLWLICGGLVAGLAWFLVGIICSVSVVGLPWARAAFNIGLFTLWPFGQSAIARDALTGRGDVGTGPAGTLGNLLWLIFAGWWLALGHLSAAIMLTCTIIGIPFAWQHVKLALMALWPIGMAVVPNNVADMAYRWDSFGRAGAWRR